MIPVSEKPVGTGNYSKALRAIGSALDALEVETKTFELTCDGANYIVRLENQKAKKPETKEVKNNGLKALQQIFSSHHPIENPSAGPLVYTPEDIDRLDREGQLRRRNAGTNPQSLTQALRAIGFYIDDKGARLLQISRRGELMTVRYETARGSSSTEEFMLSNLYALFVQMYVKRRDRRKAK
jgi:hypothetical protein